MTAIIEKISEFLWGIPLIVLILGCGIFLTIRFKGIQIRKLGVALKCMIKNEKDGPPGPSFFYVLCLRGVLGSFISARSFSSARFSMRDT